MSRRFVTMVQIIAGIKGKGKTKRLLDMANAAVKDARGTVVYLDKSSKHMYELSNKIRLVNVSEYDIMSGDGFLGFISGIISQDHDLEMCIRDRSNITRRQPRNPSSSPITANIKSVCSSERKFPFFTEARVLLFNPFPNN